MILVAQTKKSDQEKSHNAALFNWQTTPNTQCDYQKNHQDGVGYEMAGDGQQRSRQTEPHKGLLGLRRNEVDDSGPGQRRQPGQPTSNH